jgi:hypothetical protein
MDIVEEKFEEVCKPVINSFLNVMGDWLEYHALLTPRIWATKRVEDNEDLIGDIMGYGTILVGYSQYGLYGGRPGAPTDEGTSLYKLLSDEILPNIKDYPTLQEYFKLYLEDIKMIRKDELYDEGLNEFNDRYDTEFVDEEEAEEWIDNSVTFETEDISDLIFGLDLQSFIDGLDRASIDHENAMIEMYLAVFPYWYKYWKSQGIDRTRDTLEKLYKDLQKFDRIGGVSEKFILVNRAINAVHQTGSILDYYEQRYNVSEHDLKDLSNRDTREWDEELEEIGVDI